MNSLSLKKITIGRAKRATAKVRATLAVVLFCTFLLPLWGLGGFAQAQVTISGSAGGGAVNTTFTTLKAAFDALNTQTTQAGNVITISITGNTTETATAVLNQPSVSSWTSLTISPSGGAARSITGNLAAPLIDLNGADNVTINGLNTGGNSLTIDNTSTANTIGTSTVQFIADATSNTITNCTLSGATTIAGVVFFNTGVTTGNDNNTISTCNITNSGANFPRFSIASTGTSTAIDNSGNILTGNNISNFFSAGAVSSGILLASIGNSTWTITNNKLFQTATRTYTTANTHNGISVQTGDGYIITGNTIGYATSTGTGTYTMAGTVATRFIGINLAVGTTTATSVQNNTITAISLATSSGAATTNGILCGINVTAGNVNIGTVTGNTIGGSTGTALLSAVPTTTQGTIVGINTSSTGNVDIRNNIIGGLASTSPTAAIAGGITGIRCSATGTVAGLTISNNTIGNSTANNMVAGVNGTTTGSSIVGGIEVVSNITATVTVNNNTIQNMASFGTGTGYVRGIMTATSGANGTYLFTNNTISNLTTNSGLTLFSNGQCAAQGIYCGMGTNDIISQNTIFNISATNTATTNIIVAGITCAVATNTIVTRNRIYNLSNAGASTTATAPAVAAGIAIRGGTTLLTISNNMVSLGNGQTTNTAFVGIWGNYGGSSIASNIYGNSIAISGTAASGAQPSFGFYRGNFSVIAQTATVDVRNNILSNTRSGGTGKHYAISNNYGATVSATGWGTNASNYNILLGNAATIGDWGGDQTFAAWQTASASDANSQSAVTVNWTNTATADLHVLAPTTAIAGTGTNVPLLEDYDGQARYPAPDSDIGADAISPFTGTTAVIIAGSTGANGNYPNLGTAFTALNAQGTQAGNNITVSIIGNTTELATASLNQPSVSNWTSLTISPSGGAARTISGNLSGSPLINLNGADNVTINGLNTGGNSLTFVNQSTSNSAGTSTIQFVNDATNNTVTNCTINGASTMTTTTNGGTIWFSTTTGSIGNDNNTISNCNIGSDGTNLPAKAIYSSGTSTSVAHYNSNNTITGCNIFDFFSATAQSNGFYLAQGTTDWTISNNKLYQTATRTQTTGTVHACIEVASTTGNNNHLISGNTTGFTNSAGTGTYTFAGVNNSVFYPIYFSSGGATTASTVQNNIITAIDVTCNTTAGGASFRSILINTGLVNILGNTIGSTTTNDVIVITNTGTTANALTSWVILHSSATNATISNNLIGGIKLNATTAPINFTGIEVEGAGSTKILQSNVIGYSTAVIVNTTSNSANSSRVNGITIGTLATANVLNNTVRYLECAAPNTATDFLSVINGILIYSPSGTAANTYSGNLIHNLSSTASSAAVVVSGIRINGNIIAGNLVERNFIHSLSAASGTATINGITATAGATTYSNNLINLSPSVSCEVRGISETGAATNNNNLYFNTVYLGGSVTGTANSAALWSNTNTNTRNFRNNLFVNARSNAGAGKNYAAFFNYATAGTLTLDYNVYRATGTNGVLGRFNSADVAALPLISGQDANSLTTDPAFAATGTVATDYKPTVTLTGVAGTGITTQFDGTARAATPTIGAWETVAPPLAITNFTPTSGGVDVTVTITGTNFTGATAVTIGGVAARSFVVVNATTITAVVNDGFTTGLVTVTQGATATSALLGTPNYTRTACTHSLSGLIVTNVTQPNGFAGIKLEWTNGETAFDATKRILMLFKPATTNFWTARFIANNATTFTIGQVEGAVQYDFYLQTLCNSINLGDRALTTTFTPTPVGTLCVTPTNLQVTFSNMGTQAAVTWNTAAGAVQYQVMYQNTPDINGLTGSGGQQAYVATNSWNITGLTANNFYRFRVKSVCTADATVNTPFGAWLTLQAASSVADQNQAPQPPTGGVAPAPKGEIDKITSNSLPEGEGWGGAALYPNPAQDQVTISLVPPSGVRGLNTPFGGRGAYVVTDLLGRTVVQPVKFENQTTLNVKHLASGSYVVKITTEQGEVVSKKLVVE